MSKHKRHHDDEPEGDGRRRRRRRRTPVPDGLGGLEPAGLGDRGGADAQEQFIIDALHDLRDTAVREVMTPRVDVVALSIPLDVEAITKAVRESGHSSFPVHGETFDDLVGVLFVQDLFRAGWRPGGHELSAVDLSRRLRHPLLVPESRPVLDVLAEMRKQRRGFAVVVDEHGGIEGVLTVKDLVGALVGDLPDEFDTEEEAEIVRVDPRRWLVDGQTSVDDVSDVLGLELPEGDYVTLGGYLFHAFGHIPDEGETLEVAGWQLKVTEMDKRRIAKVVLKRAAEVPPSGGTDPPAEDGPGSGGGGPSARDRRGVVSPAGGSSPVG